MGNRFGGIRSVRVASNPAGRADKFRIDMALSSATIPCLSLELENTEHSRAVRRALVEARSPLSLAS